MSIFGFEFEASSLVRLMAIAIFMGVAGLIIFMLGLGSVIAFFGSKDRTLYGRVKNINTYFGTGCLITLIILSVVCVLIYYIIIGFISMDTYTGLWKTYLSQYDDAIMLAIFVIAGYIIISIVWSDFEDILDGVADWFKARTWRSGSIQKRSRGREGFRRLGIVVGVLSAIIVGLLGFVVSASVQSGWLSLIVIIVCGGIGWFLGWGFIRIIGWVVLGFLAGSDDKKGS